MSHYEWRQTCFACPEQYDLYRGGTYVGYVRYRHGMLTAQAYDETNDTRPRIYTAEVSREDDGILTSEQREFYFPRIEHALYTWRWVNRERGEPWED